MPDYKINNNVTNDKDDWRYAGQDESLLNVKLQFCTFDKYIRDHNRIVRTINE